MACERFEGNLHQFVVGDKPFGDSQQLSTLERLKEAIQVAQQAVEALVFVAETLSYPVHQGIKPSNFVIRRNGGNNVKWVCKLSHLGFSERVEDSEKIPWTAPESSAKSSVWSMGCVLHFIFTGGQHPYGQGLREQMKNISLCRPMRSGRDFLSRISQSAFRIDLLVAEMISEDVEKRPDLHSVLNSIKQWHVTDSTASSSSMFVDEEPQSPKRTAKKRQRFSKTI